MPIVLNSVTQTDKLSVINDNFQKIEDAVNSSLLWRNGNTAGEAQMARPLDMNNGQILNALVGNLRLSELAEDLTASVVSAANSAISASNSEMNAASNAASASSSSSSAGASAIAAQNSANSVAASAAQITINTSNISQNTSDISSLNNRMSIEEGKVNDIAHGGTNSNTAAGARTQLGAAASGANTDITSITGSAASLTTSRTIQTNLASTSGSGFNGTANITPGVTGTLALGNGGTGSTTASTALTALGGIPLTGTTTAPGAGIVGQVLEAMTPSDIAISANTFTNLTSLSLTAGVWEVSGAFQITASGPNLIAGNFSISQTSATAGGFPRSYTFNSPALTSVSAALPTQRLVLAATTTIYCVGWSAFSAGTASASGFIHAHRVR